MSKDRAKGEIAQFLERNGFGVEQIPEEQGRRTADLRVTESANTYYIEVKLKEDDEEALERERERLKQGEIVNQSESLGRDNSLSGIIRDGADQLRSYPSNGNTFKLIWIHAGGEDPVLQMSQVHGTLYGPVHLLDASSGGGVRLCYYYTFNEFFNLRNGLDGVVISSEKEMQLCINNFSPRAVALRASGLYNWLRGGICDPEALEQSGEAYSIHDCNCSRNNAEEVLEFARNKYERPGLIPIQMMQHSGRMRVSTENTPATPQGES